MGRIQSNIGLITGLPIGDTVTKLMQIAAKPRQMLQAQTDTFKTEQAAVTALSALLLAVKYITHNLGQEEVYNQLQATSSDSSALTANVTGDAIAGAYRFTPVRVAQNQQLLSSNLASDTEALGGGMLSFRFGSGVDRSIALGALGGGEGFARGSIRITDRSGARADINLANVQTLDDVLEAINSNTSINVTAVAQGDHIRLIDNTDETVSNLKVQEVAGGHAAASLGLAGINAAASVADGQDLVRLGAGLDLGFLNDGNGVRPSTVLPDIQYTLRDGTTGTIDLSPIEPGTSKVIRENTLGDIIAVFNAANPDKLKLAIDPDGDRLVATDLSTPDGVHSFQLQPLNESQALRDLGLDGAASGGTIGGRRILADTQTVLLSSLNGGQGFGTLGAVALTDRSGAFATVNLAGAETVEDVVDLLNTSGVGIVARVNQARNGMELVDTTGAQASAMIVADADATNTASTLGIDLNDEMPLTDETATTVNSGDMHLLVVSENTRLAALNGGAGVALGTVTIHDTTGQRAVLDLRQSGIQTVGDVLSAINRLPLSIHAELNDTGDGIRIVDTAHGGVALKVDEGATTTGRDLHILGAAASVDIGGQPTQVIDGTTTYTITLDADDSLSDLRSKVNELQAGVGAMILSDGSSKPFRLGLASAESGKAGELVVDNTGLDFVLQETARARDALLAMGEGGAAATVLISSPSNTFGDVLPGVTLGIKQAAGVPVTVAVSQSDTSVVTNVKTMVDNYNRFRTKLRELTAYDSQTDRRSVLTGDGTALRLDVDLSRLLSGRFNTSGSIHSLAEIGITLKDDGTLQFDEDTLKAAYAADPAGVRQLFTAEDLGVSAQFDALIEQMSGESNSLMSARIDALKDKIERNEDRITRMDERLKVQETRLYTQFYNMEIAIAKLRANLSALDSIRYIGDLTSSSSSSSG